jgi:hypothetical protein
VPNADHSPDGTDAFDSLLAFFREIVEGVPRPEPHLAFRGTDRDPCVDDDCAAALRGAAVEGFEP